MNANLLIGMNIFLADDDADDCDFFEDALKEITIPTKLQVSSDGLTFISNLEKVTAPPPQNIIFLDLNMPGKNGFECLQHIRHTPNLKDIPVVIFSTTDSEDAVTRTYQEGANYYIRKPSTFPKLVKALETVLTMDIWQRPQPPKENFVLAVA